MSRQRKEDAVAAAGGGSSHNENASTPSVVGVHYRVGRKIGEGSFGVIYEGTP